MHRNSSGVLTFRGIDGKRVLAGLVALCGNPQITQYSFNPGPARYLWPSVQTRLDISATGVATVHVAFDPAAVGCAEAYRIWEVIWAWHRDWSRKMIDADLDKNGRIAKRLEEIRASIVAENISWGEIAELHAMRDAIPDGDMLLREWAGIREGQ